MQGKSDGMNPLKYQQNLAFLPNAGFRRGIHCSICGKDADRIDLLDFGANRLHMRGARARPGI
jgi:hypothetical protein